MQETNYNIITFIRNGDCQVLDSFHTAIYIVNKDGDYIYCNQQALLQSGINSTRTLSLNVYRLEEQGVHVDHSSVLAAIDQKRRVVLTNRVSIEGGNTYQQISVATPVFAPHTEDLEYVLVECVSVDKLNAEVAQGLSFVSPDSLLSHSDSSDVIYASKITKSVFDTAKKIADIDATILITGETGTGKQVLVDYINANSNRANQPMVSVNCASIPENLFESELFGYEKGSFTGALKTGKEGLLSAAGNGTLFLDEINSMPLSMQGKLLHVLESRSFSRIGSNKEEHVSCRFIAASNADLKTCVEKGTFREDLYYRLNIIALRIPPLRERKEDIIPLTHHFFSDFSSKYNTHKAATPRLFQKFMAYDWPGNVRELRNIIEKLVLLSPADELYVERIPSFIDFPVQKETFDFFLAPEHHEDFFGFYKNDPEHFSLQTCIEMYESSILKYFMELTGNTYETAKLLKTNQSSVSRKIAKYGITYNKRSSKSKPNNDQTSDDT